MALFMVYMTLVAAIALTACALLERGAILMRRPVRFVWMTGMLAVVIASAIVVAGSRSDPEVLVGGGAQQGVTSVARVSPAIPIAPTLLERLEVSTARFDSALALLWLAASIGLGAGVVVLAQRARQIVRHASPGEIAGHRVLLTDDTGPAIVGVFRYRIVVPRWVNALPIQKQRLIVDHEMQHARAFDPLLLWLSAAAIVLFPWNAGLWYMMRRLRSGVELDCDRRVIASNADAKEYMTLLVDVVERVSMPRGFAAALTESPSQLQRRILVMSSSKRRFDRARASLLSVAGFVLLVGAVKVPAPASPISARANDGSAQPIATVSVRSQTSSAEAFVVYSSDSATLLTPDGQTTVAMRLITPATFRAQLAGGDVHIQSISGDVLDVSATITGGPARNAAMKADHVMLIRGGAGVRRPLASSPGLVPFMKNAADSSQVRFEHEVTNAAEQIPGTASPVYPASLRASKVEGEVIAQFVLNTDGRPDVATFKVLSATNDLFVASVREALPQMRFVPSKLEGRPVRQLIQQAFMFKLN